MPTQEKRKIERIRCYYYLKVYDKPSSVDIGSVVDISVKGMRLVGEKEFPLDTEFDFLVKLPKGYILGDSFDIKAKSRWCSRNNEDANYFETGFEFIVAERKGVVFLKTLINDFKNNALL